MASKAKGSLKKQNENALQSFEAGLLLVKRHPIFAALLERANVLHREGTPFPQDGLAQVSRSGDIYCHPKIRAEPETWARTIAHCLLHLGMEHFVEKENPVCWNIACDCVVERFLTDLKLGKPPREGALPTGISNEEKLYQRLCEDGIKPEYTGFGTAGGNCPDMIFDEVDTSPWSRRQKSWSVIFATGLGMAVQSAVDVAAGFSETLSYNKYGSYKSGAARAKAWFISSYPLLGAIAAGFKLIEDPLICQRMDIRVAAVSCGLQELYINPAAALSEEEYRFVMAHEFLHAALRHDARHEWRDSYLWNVACDFIINGWLTEMGLGERPDGLLYDEQFKGLSAEAVYDRIVTDMRTYRKLATLRGVGLGDILPGDGHWWERGEGVDLDAFYRRALGHGLEYHQMDGRGYLPEGMIEEIRALSHPPIPWDVELARWFDELFTPLEKMRSYARPSRRQSSTPDIPRPNWVVSRAALDGRTFGVVLDTSGSMERGLLATALGAIAGYSVARDVPGVRVVFCDAEAYDQGYMQPEDIAGTVRVKGRGGTILQSGIDLLERADDFPEDAPMLIITDGYCEDRLVLYGREHAFLIPAGASLPFVPKGKVFRVRD
jgi:predicted metal-dependent peptidase